MATMMEPVKVVPNSDVVFDWDNTLKKIVRNPTGGPHKLETSVSMEILNAMIHEKKCRVFIVSAISNSFLGCETLKMEVERLNLRQFFLLPDQQDKCVKQETPVGVFWRWGNIITSGYTPKADVYIHCCQQDDASERVVYFFDDEINNIDDFQQALPDSKVFHVVDQVPIMLIE